MFSGFETHSPLPLHDSKPDQIWFKLFFIICCFRACEMEPSTSLIWVEHVSLSLLKITKKKFSNIWGEHCIYGEKGRYFEAVCKRSETKWARRSHSWPKNRDSGCFQFVWFREFIRNVKRNESKCRLYRYKLFIVRLKRRFKMSLEALYRGKPWIGQQ